MSALPARGVERNPTPSEVAFGWLCKSRRRRVCLDVLVFSVSVIVLCLLLFFTMGQTVSTPLSLTKDHWTDVRARGQNLSVKVKSSSLPSGGFGFSFSPFSRMARILVPGRRGGGRGQNLSVKVKKKPWMTFCSSEWPVFGVGWPAEGTFYLPTIRAVKAIVFQEGPGSHPDQQPYIMVWEDLAH